MLVRYGFDYKSTLGQTVLVEALAENGTPLFQQMDTLTPSGVYVSKTYTISLDALSGVTFKVTPQLGNELFLDNFILNQFVSTNNIISNGDFSSAGTWVSNNGGVNLSQYGISPYSYGCGDISVGSGTNTNIYLSQSVSLVNGHIYDFSFYIAARGSYNLTMTAPLTEFRVASNIALTSVLFRFKANAPTFHQATPEYIKSNGNYEHTAATGTYYVGINCSKGEGHPATGPVLSILTDDFKMISGSFSSSNLFKNPSFAANGNDWDYNTGVWAWNAGEMRFEII